MLQLSNKSTKKGDETIFPEYKYNIREDELLVCFINAAVGTGILKLGSAFRAGVITSLILTVVIGILSYYSMWFFLKASTKTLAGSFEEIWKVLWGKRFIWFCAFLSIIRKINTLKGYFSFISETITNLISVAAGTLPWWASNKLFLVSILCVVFVVPLAFCRTLRVVVITSQISCVCILVLFGIVIYYFAIGVKTDGFDPNHEMVLFGPGNNVVSCLSSLMTAYLIYPLAYPGFNHLKNASYNKLNRISIVQTVIVGLLNYAFGLVNYLTLFESNTGGLILSYFPQGPVRIVGEIALVLMILFTIPVVISPIKYIILNCIATVRTIQYWIWIYLGIIIGVLCVFLSAVSGEISTYLGIISDILSPIVLYIIPTSLYLKACGKESMFHFCGAIFCIIVGIGFLCFIIQQRWFN